MLWDKATEVGRSSQPPIAAGRSRDERRNFPGGFSAVRDCVFTFRGELRHGHPKIGKEKERIIAKAAGALR